MATAPKCPGCQRTEVGFEFALIHSELDGHLLIVSGGQMRLCNWMCLAANRSTFGGKTLEEKPLTSTAKHGEIWQTKSRADIEYCLKATLDRSGAELERLKKKGWVRNYSIHIDSGLWRLLQASNARPSRNKNYPVS